MDPTDVRSLPWMLNDLSPLVRCRPFYFKPSESWRAPRVSHDMCFWSQPVFTTEMDLLRVGFLVGFPMLPVSYCPPPFSPAMLAESAVERMTVQLNWALALGNPFGLG